MFAPILFVGLLAGISSGLRSHKAGGVVHSAIPDAGTVCFEGSDYSTVGKAATYFRAGPLAAFSAHSSAQQKKSCAESGFTKLVTEDNGCFKDLSLYTKETFDVNKTLTELRAQNKDLMQAYADHRNISYKNSEKWAICGGGCAEGTQTGFMWWGADKKYSQFDCMFAIPMILPNLRTHTAKIGSFVVDSGLLCWEGAFEYMAHTLGHLKRTPGGDLFKNATVKEQTCAELGYDSTRDARDECWPDATKTARSAQNERHVRLGNWGEQSQGNDACKRHGTRVPRGHIARFVFVPVPAWRCGPGSRHVVHDEKRIG
jgi:hypothetical protein